jgi:putative transposase
MIRKSYSTDLTDEEWALIQPFIPADKVRGRKRTVDLREILNAIFYIIRAGCQWRMLPHDFLVWKTVTHFFAGGGKLVVGRPER